MCISSKCCKNISTIITEMGDLMEIPCSGW